MGHYLSMGHNLSMGHYSRKYGSSTLVYRKVVMGPHLGISPSIANTIREA